MIHNQAIKRNLSSLQVLKTFQTLLRNNYTMAELIEKLNKNEPEPVFNNSVVSKYINTCRACGIEIYKIHNRYYVASIPFGLDLNSTDMDLLEVIQCVVRDKMSAKLNEKFGDFIVKLSKYSNKRIMRVEEKTMPKIADLFDRAIFENRKILLMFRAKAFLECIPVAIVENNGKKCFKVIYKNKTKLITCKRITGLQILHEKYLGIKPEGIVYKLTGGLAQRYSPRENEEIILDCRPESITICNKDEPKEALYMRLLRYDKSCEVLKPLTSRKEMINILDGMLRNYEE